MVRCNPGGWPTTPITCHLDQFVNLWPVFTLVGSRTVHDPETTFGEQG